MAYYVPLRVFFLQILLFIHLRACTTSSLDPPPKKKTTTKKQKQRKPTFYYPIFILLIRIQDNSVFVYCICSSYLFLSLFSPLY